MYTPSLLINVRYLGILGRLNMGCWRQAAEVHLPVGGQCGSKQPDSDSSSKHYCTAASCREVSDPEINKLPMFMGLSSPSHSTSTSCRSEPHLSVATPSVVMVTAVAESMAHLAYSSPSHIKPVSRVGQSLLVYREHLARNPCLITVKKRPKRKPGDRSGRKPVLPAFKFKQGNIRQPSAYSNFMQGLYKEGREQRVPGAPALLLTEISKAWKDLGPAGQAPFVLQAAAARETADLGRMNNKEMEAALAAAVTAHKRQPSSGYQLFLKDLAQEQRQAGIPHQYKLYLAIATKDWASMSDLRRNAFLDRAEEEKQVWLAEHTDLDTQLKAAGHAPLYIQKLKVKRAPSAHNLYMQEQLAGRSKPVIDLPLVMKQLFEDFRQLSPAQKLPYKQFSPAAQRPALVCTSQEAARLAGKVVVAKDFAREFELRAVAGPFQKYTELVRHDVAKALPGGSSEIDINRAVRVLWRKLTAEGQQVYRDLYTQDCIALKEKRKEERAASTRRVAGAYIRFYKAMCGNKEALFPPGAPKMTWRQAIGKLWRDMPDDQRQPYKDEYLAEKKQAEQSSSQ